MAGPANPPGQPKGGFNKLFVMLPVMLAARKLDAEDPQTVQYLRMAYGSMQSLCVLVVLYTFMKASSIDDKKASNIVYIPAPPTVRCLWPHEQYIRKRKLHLLVEGREKVCC